MNNFVIFLIKYPWTICFKNEVNINEVTFSFVPFLARNKFHFNCKKPFSNFTRKSKLKEK